MKRLQTTNSTDLISTGNCKDMRIETRNFCWGMDSDDVEEGFVIPFCPGVQQGMDGVIIETKCVPESEYTLESVVNRLSHKRSL